MNTKTEREEIRGWEKELNLRIASLLIASSLFQSQVSPQGGKTINFSVYEEHLKDEIAEFKAHIRSLLSSKAKEIGDRIGEDEKLPIMSEHTIESNKLLIEQVGARNAERKRLRSIVKEVLNNK